MRRASFNATITIESRYSLQEKTIKNKFVKWLREQGFTVQSADVIDHGEIK